MAFFNVKIMAYSASIIVNLLIDSIISRVTAVSILVLALYFKIRSKYLRKFLL